MAPHKLQKDDAAQVGIGTMIVFIATILVAAVAAGVLIDTSQKLQAKSTQTGDAATANVGTSLTILGAEGSRDSTANPNLQQLDITVTLSPGADPVDLASMIIQYNNGTGVTVADWVAATTAADTTDFEVTFLRDSDSSGANNVMTAGDLVQITVGATSAGGGANSLGISNNQAISVTLVPPTGHDVGAGFTADPSFGTATTVTLI